ncbi:R3H domain-containing nucleic acid-binding protein [Chloroflexota bacterium]
MDKLITDDLDALLGIFPDTFRDVLSKHENVSGLLEVVMDLGRNPEARFLGNQFTLSSREISGDDLDYVISRVNTFGEDNRAGIERTLHRISAIRNRKGRILGLTCRVGRAVFGTIKIVEDLVNSGKSILLLGGPGVGKTTMLREIARVLADDLNKRVVIVDTSNEIAGDGDIPHPAIGKSRRMQVATPALQHAVMIEAIENHMPEVIVIDEIGTELEALAARTIAERGVQLVGTAHGNSLNNLLMNPTLTDLVGGIQSVTLGDEEAKRRGTQKSILERRSPATFDIVVEILGWDRVRLHPDVSTAVDHILRGEQAETEERNIDVSGQIQVAKATPSKPVGAALKTGFLGQAKTGSNIFAFGINRAKILQVATDMGLSLTLVSDFKNANIFITSKNYYRRKPQTVIDAERANLPIYVLKSNTPSHIRQLLSYIFDFKDKSTPTDVKKAIAEAEQRAVQIDGDNTAMELSPQTSYVRRLQHLIAERYSLSSSSVGKDASRRVRLYKESFLENDENDIQLQQTTTEEG